jgi:hypothetical protein
MIIVLASSMGIDAITHRFYLTSPTPISNESNPCKPKPTRTGAITIQMPQARALTQDSYKPQLAQVWATKSADPPDRSHSSRAHWPFTAFIVPPVLGYRRIQMVNASPRRSDP